MLLLSLVVSASMFSFSDMLAFQRESIPSNSVGVASILVRIKGVPMAVSTLISLKLTC